LGLEHHPTSSAEGLERVEFATAIRGYDKHEVDTFLRELAAEHNRMMAELDAARNSAEKSYLEMGEEVGDLLQHARDTADQIMKLAEEESAAIKDGARRAAEKTASEAARHADEVRSAAETSALRKIREAQDKLRQLKAAEQEVRARMRTIAETIHSLSIQIADIESTTEIDVAARDDAGEIDALTREATTSPTPSPA
jgi:DivIVA domain-containing protein